MSYSEPKCHPQLKKKKKAFGIFIFFLWLFCLKESNGNPEIVLHPTEKWVHKGQTVILTCKFRDVKKAENCFWHFNDEVISVEEFNDYKSLKTAKDTCQLQIKNVDISRDSGDWHCSTPRTQNINSLISKKAFLGVFVPPLGPYLYRNADKIKNQTSILVKTEMLTLKCETQLSSPQTQIIWNLNDTLPALDDDKVENEASNFLLKKTTSTRTIKLDSTWHDRTVKCTIIHENTNKSIEVKLNILYKTNTVTITTGYFVAAKTGDNLSFNCNANGNPAPSYTWKYKEKKEASHWITVGYDATFTKTAHKSDTGVYLCHAGNFNTTEFSPELTVDVVDKESRLLQGVIGPIVGAFAFLFLIAIALFIFWRQRQGTLSCISKPTTSEDNEKPQDEENTNKDASVNDGDPTESNSKPSSSIGSSPTDNNDYLLTRPLPKIEAEGDSTRWYDYERFDPASDSGVEGDGTESNRESHIYEEPRLYENTISLPPSIQTAV